MKYRDSCHEAEPSKFSASRRGTCLEDYITATCYQFHVILLIIDNKHSFYFPNVQMFSRPPGVAGVTAICPNAVLFSLLVGRLVVGLGPKFLHNGSQPFQNGSPRNLYTSLLMSQA